MGQSELTAVNFNQLLCVQETFTTLPSFTLFLKQIGKSALLDTFVLFFIQFYSFIYNVFG